VIQNAAIDVAIALALMYLLLSLTCTVVNEYIASRLNLRAKSLAVALQALLDDPRVLSAFYDHGAIAGTRMAVTTAGSLSLVRSLRLGPSTATPSAPAAGTAAPTAAASATRAPAAGGGPSGDTHPSYLAANTFVLALLGSLIVEKAGDLQSIPKFDDFEAAIKKLPPSNLRDALVTNLTVAQGDLEKFRRGLATWFDDSMDRLSGAYRRHLKVISFVVGCLLAIALNADSFAVGRALWSDSTLRAQMVQVAESTVKAPTDSGTGQTQPPTADEITRRLAEADTQLRPLPIGWSLRANGSLDKLEHNIGSKPLSYWPLKLLGLFATGLALSFGAPFWFDALSKFMSVRAAGAKPARQT
jgi:hypothetical protein